LGSGSFGLTKVRVRVRSGSADFSEK